MGRLAPQELAVILGPAGLQGLMGLVAPPAPQGNRAPLARAARMGPMAHQEQTVLQAPLGLAVNLAQVALAGILAHREQAGLMVHQVRVGQMGLTAPQARVARTVLLGLREVLEPLAPAAQTVLLSHGKGIGVLPLHIKSMIVSTTSTVAMSQ